MKPALVVLGWAGWNAVLMLVMIPYRENALFIGMYALAVSATAAAAGVVWLYRRSRRAEGPVRMAANSLSAGFLAVAVILAGSSVLFGQWLTGIAFYFAVAALLHVRRERVPAGALPGPTAVPTEPGVRDQRGVLPKAAKAAATAGLLTRALRTLTGRRKGAGR
ncbi:hypothetical protein B0I33_11543 [Prauserella shujinwangii]|uniref:Uncharacterized protein n=1 Tax=Prauserella shujinwangii TaxID=1453103 RepID=A0A2T0LKK4_9PSEU|nr:hypothetical protein [Prauserella shujinwangii]PRX43425.1 hypothetical protein B0I33_11543 [Prauserella shujinwangii]